MTRPTRPLKITRRFTTAAARDDAWSKGVEGMAARRTKATPRAAVASSLHWESRVRDLKARSGLNT